MEHDAQETGGARRTRALWLAFLAGPVAALLLLLADYALAGAACTAASRTVLHAVAALCLATALAGWRASWRGWSATGRAWPDSSDGGPTAHLHLLGSLGVLGGGLFVLFILAQWLAVLVLDPCAPAPR
jgi:hypothetical protein